MPRQQPRALRRPRNAYGSREVKIMQKGKKGKDVYDANKYPFGDVELPKLKKNIVTMK